MGEIVKEVLASILLALIVILSWVLTATGMIDPETFEKIIFYVLLIIANWFGISIGYGYAVASLKAKENP